MSEHNTPRREIKFRLFNKKSREMLYECVGVLPNRNESFAVIGSDGVLVNPSKDGDRILMQYTGLKDKNGKEIYEGDVLIGGVEFLPPAKPQYHVVTWETKQTWHGMVDGHLSKSVGFTFEYYYFTESGCEVIGNIYENPELLKSKHP